MCGENLKKKRFFSELRRNFKIKKRQREMRERLDRFFRKPLPRFFFCLGLPLAILWILVSIVFYRIIENWTWVQATFYSVNVFMGVYVSLLQYVIQTQFTHTNTHTEDMDIQLLAQIMENGSQFYIRRSEACA